MDQLKTAMNVYGLKSTKGSGGIGTFSDTETTIYSWESFVAASVRIKSVNAGHALVIKGINKYDNKIRVFDPGGWNDLFGMQWIGYNHFKDNYDYTTIGREYLKNFYF